MIVAFSVCSFCFTRVIFNGDDTGCGSHLSLFVHMMESEMDDTLEWPFSGRFFLSILDQRDDGEYKRHISKTLVTRPNLLAFQRPTTPRNHKGYGYVEFAHLETLQERQYVKNDCLLVQVQVYNWTVCLTNTFSFLIFLLFLGIRCFVCIVIVVVEVCLHNAIFSLRLSHCIDLGYVSHEWEHLANGNGDG